MNDRPVIHLLRRYWRLAVFGQGGFNAEGQSSQRTSEFFLTGLTGSFGLFFASEDAVENLFFTTEDTESTEAFWIFFSRFAKNKKESRFGWGFHVFYVAFFYIIVWRSRSRLLLLDTCQIRS